MSTRDEKLDLIRGVSALLVLAGHARNFVMCDFNEIPDHSFITKIFYIMTSLHHEAVVIFVVMSGYFIGGSVIRTSKAGKFRWPGYAIDRMSRLWIVLLPGLLLTLVLDKTGSSMNSEAYEGGYRHLFNMGPSTSAPALHDMVVFLGNLFSLQTILVPTYGSNGPLWSLSFLFWYDVLFPVLICGILNPAVPKKGRLAFAIVFVCGMSFLPHVLLLKGLIWLVGVGVWGASQRSQLQRATRTWIWKIGGGLAFSVVLLASKAGAPIPGMLTAIAFGIWMLSLLGPWPVYGWWSKASKWMSEISFSLYVIHFPVMFLVTSCLLRGRLFEPSIAGIFWFVVLCAISILSARLFWRLFESKTGRLRKWLKSTMLRTSQL